LTLNQSVAGVVRAPGTLVIDRVDTSGNSTPTKREYITFTGVSGADLTGLTRGSANSTDQVHAVGAIVELVPDVDWANGVYNTFISEHTTGGVHASLPSITQAVVQDLTIGKGINASGASVAGLNKIVPVWVLQGVQSGASTGILPIDMPSSGTIEWVSMTLSGPASGASLVIDINKNFTSIFDDNPSILSSGTFVSTASISTKTFSEGDVFSVDVDNASGSDVDAVIKFHAR